MPVKGSSGAVCAVYDILYSDFVKPLLCQQLLHGFYDDSFRVHIMLLGLYNHYFLFYFIHYIIAVSFSSILRGIIITASYQKRGTEYVRYFYSPPDKRQASQ